MSAFETLGVGVGVGVGLSAAGETTAEGEGEGETAGVLSSEQPANILSISRTETPARSELFIFTDIFILLLCLEIEVS